MIASRKMAALMRMCGLSSGRGLPEALKWPDGCRIAELFRVGFAFGAVVRAAVWLILTVICGLLRRLRGRIAGHILQWEAVTERGRCE
jgi:hypothetical protein